VKEIILVRHAKSDWPNGTADIERPLSDRGRNDCRVAADYFCQVGDLASFEVHVSIALRTAETWKLISEQLPVDLKVVSVDEIYEASLGDLFGYLQNLESHSLIFVGHNPGLALLGSFLTGDQISKFPTLSIWHIQTNGEWLPESGQTISRIAPRANKDSSDID
jgi:phosphohistidine phosphatase